MLWQSAALALLAWSGVAAQTRRPSAAHLDTAFAALRQGDTATAVTSLTNATRADSADATPLVALAYIHIARQSPRAAVRELERAVVLTPRDTVLHKQLAYLHAKLEDRERALASIEAAEALGVQDPHLDLQAAYLLDALGRRDEAGRRFERIARSGPEDLRGRARAELAARAPSVVVWSTELYAAPMYQTRFEDNGVLPAIARSGPVLEERRGLQVYGSLRTNSDVGSAGARQSDVLTDNAVVIALGARLRPIGGGFTVYAEAGPAFPLPAATETQDALTGDFRAGVYDFIRWGGTLEDRRPEPFADLYFDASYYSRFDDDVIGYVQLRPGVRLPAGAGAIDVYTPLLGVVDSRRVYYNNIAETGLGARWAFDERRSIVLSAEWLAGWYLVRRGAPSHGYADLRLSVILSRYLARSRRPERR